MPKQALQTWPMHPPTVLKHLRSNGRPQFGWKLVQGWIFCMFLARISRPNVHTLAQWPFLLGIVMTIDTYGIHEMKLLNDMAWWGEQVRGLNSGENGFKGGYFACSEHKYQGLTYTYWHNYDSSDMAGWMSLPACLQARKIGGGQVLQT